MDPDGTIGDLKWIQMGLLVASNGSRWDYWWPQMDPERINGYNNEPERTVNVTHPRHRELNNKNETLSSEVNLIEQS